MTADRLSTDQECPAHPAPGALGYLAAHADADARMKRREIQRQCRLCGLWIWTDQYTDASAMGMTDHMFNRSVKETTRRVKRKGGD